MHRFHQSRGKILFEVFCASAIAASLAVAWSQTGASALAAAGAVTALFAVVHLFDLRQGPAERDERQPAEATASPVPAALPLEPEAPSAKVARPAKAPRKAKARKVSRAEPAKLTPPEAPVSILVAVDGSVPAPTPLFDPEPFVRQQRAIFGRKSG